MYDASSIQPEGREIEISRENQDSQRELPKGTRCSSKEKTLPSPEEVGAWLDYHPRTGEFWWKKGKQSGKRAGYSKSEGYRCIKLFGVCVYEHRLAFYLERGFWPPDKVDHKNGNPSDNRFKNLRLATHSENMMNTRLWRTNTSGVKGVSWCERLNRWRVRLTVNRRERHFGYYENFEDAKTASKEAHKKAHGRFAPAHSL